MENNNEQTFGQQTASLLMNIVLYGAIFAMGIAFGAGATAFLGGAPGGQLPVPSIDYQASANQPEDVDMQVFWEAWNTVNDRFYYDLPQDQDRVYGAIRGMLDSLDDPYTAFTNPEVTEILNEDNTGDFEGIGAYVQQAPDGGVLITSVFEGGPAEQAGLRSGDVIVEVDDEDVTDQILNETLLMIRGPQGTDVDLTVFREGEEELLEFTVTRDRIEIPTVEAEMIDGNIGYVQLFQFNGQATPRLQDAVRDLLDEGAEAIILDLRDNPGGFRSEAISVADLFLPRGVVMIQRDVDGNEREFSADNGDLAEDIPLVVLINGSSASASEIVAGAFRDYDRGTLIGETTFGKGSVQGLYDLSDGSQIRVTIANFYSPDDITLNGIGVEPDITVEDNRSPDTEDDAILDRAIEYITNEIFQ